MPYARSIPFEIQYPLVWPEGWVRTVSHSRQRARFAVNNNPVSFHAAGKQLMDELRRLGAQQVRLTTNVSLKRDGQPRGMKEPDDPGASCLFILSGQQRAFACDRWRRVADNITAMARHVESLRAIERYGVGNLNQAFAGYAPRLQAAAVEWWLVLGVQKTATPDQVEAAYRQLARTHHPDAGGSAYQMAKLSEARDEYYKTT